MKYLSGYILLFSAVLLSSGCSENSGSISTDAYPLSVSSVSLSGVQTRSTTPLATDGATISVSTLCSGVVNATSQYAYTGGAWNKSAGCSDLVIPEGTALCAYYPYAAGITDKAAIPLCSAKYDTARDLSYAYSTAVADAARGTCHTAFALQHAYARLTFKFSCASSYKGSKSISNIIISNPGILSGASLNITGASGVYRSKVAGDVIFDAGISDFSATSSTSVLMVPTDALSENIRIVIQVGADYKQLILPAAFFANSKLEAGVNYQVLVNVVESGTLTLSSSDVQTTEWVVPSSVTNTLVDQPESNCYIVPPGGTILIPVSRASNGNAGEFSETDDFTTGLLWSDVSATHVSATAMGRYIKVVAGNTEGNSVIYAKNKSTGTTVWSWHIWVTRYSPGNDANTGANTTTYDYNSHLWMDRNLGATTTTPATQTTQGLLYQWGRKDPFPGSLNCNENTEPTLYGEQTAVTKIQVYSDPNLANSIHSPLTFYFDPDVNRNNDWYGVNTQNNTLWYDGSPKTIYDPCPVGWRVPYNGTASPWNGLSSNGGTWNSGYSWTGNPNIGYYPATGARGGNHGNFYGVGVIANYWSATPNDVSALSMWISREGVYLFSKDWRSSAFSVRCVKI
jgi:hypothetical protein